MKQKLIILLILSLVLVGNAVAYVPSTSTGLSSDIQFNAVTNTIEAVVPIFTSLTHLVVAVVPYIICLTLFGGLVFFYKDAAQR